MPVDSVKNSPDSWAGVRRYGNTEPLTKMLCVTPRSSPSAVNPRSLGSPYDIAPSTKNPPGRPSGVGVLAGKVSRMRTGMLNSPASTDAVQEKAPA
jgi:hypothetical protein